MRFVWAVLLVFGLTGCASLPGLSRPETPRTAAPASPDAADEVATAQIGQLQRQAAMAEAEIKLLRRQLAALEVEVERLSARAEQPVAAAPPTMRSEPPVRPPVDHFEASELEPVRIEPQVTGPESGSEVGAEVAEPQRPAASAPPVERPTVAPRVPTAAVPQAGQAIYDSGYTLYHQGRFVDAESSFQRFLQAHGNTELADNAQFWIGESRFARGDHMGALLAFQEVLDVYPGGNKIADALLKLGDCLVNLDNREGGRQRYEEVLRRFPGSAAAAIAEERLSLPRD